MDQFVTEFAKNPHKWRSRLTEDQRAKIQTFVNNIADVTPKTDKLALEARIIARRHPHITVVQEEVAIATPAIAWPPKKIPSRMAFFKWMWMNNRDYMINKYMTSEYNAEHAVNQLNDKLSSRVEASKIWYKCVKDNDVLLNSIEELMNEHCAKILNQQVAVDELSSESEDESESPNYSTTTNPAVHNLFKKIDTKVAFVEKAPMKKATSTKQQDSEGEEVYSDEANYESDESEDVVTKNDSYVPKADSESE